MNSKASYFLSIGILAVIGVVLFCGCATTQTTSKTEGAMSPVSDEMPREVKAPEFILGPGDKIEVMVYRHDDLRRVIQIDTSGKINYPLIGDIQAGGLSVFQLRDSIRDKLSEYFINPQVSVAIASVQSQRVVVLGEVKNPGLFALDSPLSAVEAISKAGGFTVDAKQKNVLLIRGGLKNPDLVMLNMANFFEKRDMTQNVHLQNGDIIYIPATFIANVSRYFEHLSKILSPMIQMETGYFIGQQIESSSQRVTVPLK